MEKLRSGLWHTYSYRGNPKLYARGKSWAKNNNNNKTPFVIYVKGKGNIHTRRFVKSPALVGRDSIHIKGHMMGLVTLQYNREPFS